MFGGVGPGFDYLRLILASIIFYVHAGAILHGRPEQNLLIVAAQGAKETNGWASAREPLYVLLVPLFFALSGFLVTGSALRLGKVLPFLAFRALRIFPALTVEVLLSAVVIGAAMTSYDLARYFADAGSWAYLLNIVGDVHFFLPGVFERNPLSIVNNNLWTLPPEFYCYLTIGLVIASGLVFKPRAFSLLFAACTLALLIHAGVSGLGRARGNLPVVVIVYYFFMGSLMHQWRRIIPFHIALVMSAAAAGYVLTYLHMVVLAPPFVTYFIVGCGVLRWPKIARGLSGDYSYGVYLYGFPITQLVFACAAGLRSHELVFKLVAFLATCLFAVVSWHAIEKPALKLKRLFVASRRDLLALPKEGSEGDAPPCRLTGVVTAAGSNVRRA